MRNSKFWNSKKLPIILLVLFIYILTTVFGANVTATQQTINVADGVVSDWGGVAAFNDSYGDVSGVGPNDLIKLWVTSDATNIYCRWDVILSGSKAKVTSAAYSLALNSQRSAGTTRPTVEARAYVVFNAQGAVSAVAIENTAKKISLPLTNAEQISTGVAKTLVSIEAKFPFSSFNTNTMTVNPLGPTSVLPLWGEALSSGAFNSAVKDTVPDTGFLDYDAVNAVSAPKGTGPVANITIAAINDNVVPSAIVDYVATLKNVGDNTGNPNLLFNSVQWTLPAGFTYVSGSSTGLTTANPTVSSGVLTWAISGGSLAPSAMANIHFKATASNTNGSYYSSAVVVATTPSITYNTGDGAVVNVDPKYVVPAIPLNLVASGTTQTTTTLSWSTANNAVAYDIYDNNVEIVTNTTSTLYVLTGLEAGSTHSYTVRSKSAIDVESNSSNAVSVTTISPYTVTVNNLTTKNNQPTLTGTTNAPNGNTVSVVIGGNTYTGTVSGGLWSIHVTNTLADNTYTATASLTSAVGNLASGAVIIDTVAPTITVTNFATNDTKPSIRGTTNAIDGSVVTVIINSVQYTGIAYDGLWGVETTTALAVGGYTASASVTDVAGNTGTASGTVTINAIILSSNNNLSNLTSNAGAISPDFASTTTDYTLNVGRNVDTITLTPTAQHSEAIIRVEGVLVSSGATSSNISLSEGANYLKVRVTAEDGSIKIYNVTVNRAYHVIDVTLDKNSVSIYQLANTTLIATVNPSNAEDKTVTWSSSDESVATVNASGFVAGVAPGVAVITVTTNDGGKTASCDVTVNMYDVTINNLVTKNNQPTLTGTTNAPDGSTISVVIGGNTYTGLVSSGLWSVPITGALADGTYTAQASLSNAVSNTASGTVLVDTIAPSISVVNINTNEKSPTIRGTTNAVDGSIVTVTIHSFEYTCIVEDGVWSVHTTADLSDDSYTVSASVTDVTGNTGTANGTVVIDTVVRSLNDNLSNLITNAGNISPTFASAITEYTLNVASNVSSIAVTPTADDSKAIIRVNGVIVLCGSASGSMSLSEGANHIAVRVTAEDGSTKTYNLIINRAYGVTGVSLDQATAAIYEFESVDLAETISPTNAGDKSVTWSSSDENVATVDSNGVVTGVENGTAIITVTTNDGGKTAACTVTVSEANVIVTITDEDKLHVNIHGWKETYRYQIWTYQTVTSDVFLNVSSNVRVNQWILSSEYTLGSMATQEPDGSISFIIDLPANTPDGNYVVSVKIQDENGNFAGQLKNTYTPESIGFVTITNVFVDGDITFGNETREIKTGASVRLEIAAVNSDSYSVFVNGVAIFPYSSNNSYVWDISDKLPGKYTLVFNARNTSSGSAYTETVIFTLYSKNANIKYGILNSMNVSSEFVSNKHTVTLAPSLLNGDFFYYTIGEPGRAPTIHSNLLAKAANYEQILAVKRIGIYQVAGYITRAGASSYDDGFLSTIVNPRGGGTVGLNLFLDSAPINDGATITSVKNTEMNFSAIATLGSLNQSEIEYSFWRYDATGYVLVKDWSNSNALSWTPARVGAYTIQIRAKGVDAGSYEVVKNVNVNVSTSEIAQNVSISVNSVYLNANATARVPIVINADATAANGDPLLYKFYVSDANLGTSLLQEYSPIQSCQWTPRKAGLYKISVLIKNSASFGKYDAIQSYEITVK